MSGLNKITELFIPVKPVPASRPKVTNFGTYYSKPYMEFRNQMSLFLSKIKHKYPQTNKEFLVTIEFICRKPKSPSNSYPIGDVDNYLKGPLDSFTKAAMFWEDDVQVIILNGSKRYQEDDEPYGMKVHIMEYA